MHPSLRQFVREYLYVLLATLLPVCFVAFVSMPLALGGHPGDVRLADIESTAHMS